MFRENGVARPFILFARTPLDEALRLQAIDEKGEAATRDQDAPLDFAE
jgi:hypothetical protein